MIWLGDFNYRIGLSNEKVQKLCHVGDLETLYENDQVLPRPPTFSSALYANDFVAEPPDGRWPDIPLLF